MREAGKQRNGEWQYETCAHFHVLDITRTRRLQPANASDV